MKNASVTLITVLLALMAGNTMAAEEAEYSVTVQNDKLEIREYAPSIVAEVVVSDTFEDASGAAFRKLFNYISGDNTGRSKIAMTSPVTQKQEPEKIAMTSPVGQHKSDQGWAVSFMMPAFYTMDTIPIPDDPSVVLRQIPAYRAAAIRYSGRWSEKAYKKQLLLLQEWIEEEELEITGDPLWARYNAPFTPWFMRRNEILIPISQ
ncbi:MAG: heme-binding protein [Xanthomonadales bacterium]|nr:heme-binding protein [Xanthomonadales bacterium]